MYWAGGFSTQSVVHISVAGSTSLTQELDNRQTLRPNPDLLNHTCTLAISPEDSFVQWSVARVLFVLATSMACRSFWARDCTHFTAVTQTSSVTMPDP